MGGELSGCLVSASADGVYALSWQRQSEDYFPPMWDGGGGGGWGQESV